MPNNPDLLGELSGEQEVIGSLGMDIKIIYRGFTAYIDGLTVDENGNLIIELTNSQGEHTFVDAGHVKGDQGITGYYFTPSIDEDYDLSWSNNGGLPNPQTKNIKGVKGDKGDPGTSPEVTVTRTSDGATVVIVDDSGTTSTNLYDGYHIGSVQLTGGSVMPGQTATYTMYLNDSDTNPTPVGTFQVRNGSDGTGVGDMVKEDYDSDGDGKVNDADHADTATTATTAANAEKLGGQLPSYYAAAGDIPTNVSDLTNDAGYITDADIATKADLVNGKVPEGQLPSYVDDVLEYDSIDDFPQTGENGKIYIAINTNLTYRWGGTGYVAINSALALGETSSTAYRGDRGKTAYDHSQITSGNPHGTTAMDIGAAELQNGKIISSQIPDDIASVVKLSNNMVVNGVLPANSTVRTEILLPHILTSNHTYHFRITLTNYSETIIGNKEKLGILLKPAIDHEIDDYQALCVFSQTDTVPNTIDITTTINEYSQIDRLSIRATTLIEAQITIDIEEIFNLNVSNTLTAVTGSDLINDTLYIVTDPVDSAVFRAYNIGWSHGIFTTGSSPQITFNNSFGAAKFIGEAPIFKPNTTYEFDVLNNVWIFAEVVDE